MKTILILLFVLIPIESFTQQINEKLVQNFFDLGMEAYINRDLKAAEEYFVKSYKNNRDKNSLFNIGLVRLELNDICSACEIFLISKNKFKDKESINIYNEYCIKNIDTTYYDKNYTRQDSNKYKYYQEDITYHCNSTKVGIVHKKGFRSSTKLNEGTINLEIVDVYATYYVVDSIKYYEYIYNSKFNNVNRVIIENFKKRMKDYLNQKYYNSITINPDYFTVVLYVDKSGRIVDNHILSDELNNIEVEDKHKLIHDANQSIQGIQILKPERFMNDNVNKRYQFNVYL